jgi:hypothetical protein
MSEDVERDTDGGCLCGAVRYRVRGPLRGVVNCHCCRCRRTHGHVGAYTEAATERVTLLVARGLHWYVTDGRARGFCRECGASLFWRRDAAVTSIAAGTVDPPTGLRTVAHIFVDSKGDYYDIEDELPQHGASAPLRPVPRSRSSSPERG